MSTLIITNPEPLVSNKITTMLITEAEEESHIIVHCTCLSGPIRIWRSTFLVDESSGFRTIMKHCEGISLYPQWMEIPDEKPHTFTLFFNSMPKECSVFHLLEIIPEEGGFEVMFIERNEQDVYWVEI